VDDGGAFLTFVWVS